MYRALYLFFAVAVLPIAAASCLCGCETVTALTNKDISMSEILNLEEEPRTPVYYVDTHEKYVDVPEETRTQKTVIPQPAQVKRSDSWVKDNLW
jgi:hypothetical protein